MIYGYNKANSHEKGEWEWHAQRNYSVKSRSCVFLSHKNEDKPACHKIAKYLKKAGIDYYLDENDKDLQRAVSENNAYKITESIKKGIRNSTHMLCVVSQKTKTSSWVPFEVGYGHAAIIDKSMIEGERDKKIKLSILTLKDLSEEELPDFMKVGNIIRGIKGINKYISKITNKSENELKNKGRIEVKMYSSLSHSLDNVLNWQK